MDIQDRFWDLAAKRLANEASEDELHELNELLHQNPDIHDKLKLLTEWWHDDREQQTEHNNFFLFKKILDRIEDSDHKAFENCPEKCISP